LNLNTFARPRKKIYPKRSSSAAIYITTFTSSSRIITQNSLELSPCLFHMPLYNAISFDRGGRQYSLGIVVILECNIIAPYIFPNRPNMNI
jgi:hypothetical protein